MKPFSEKTQIATSIATFVGLTLLGLNNTFTIIGICLFIPITFVQTCNFCIEHKLSLFKPKDGMKFLKAAFKGKI